MRALAGTGTATPIRSLSCVLLAVAGGGCGVDTEPGAVQENTSSHRTEASATYSLESLPTYRAEPEMRIDGYDADLVRITGLSVSSDGTIAFAQPQDAAVAGGVTEPLTSLRWAVMAPA